MAFSSIPPYLDQPNWHQTNTQPRDSNTNADQLGDSSSRGASSHFSLPPHLAPTHKHNEAGSCSIRPGSMADQARMANIPLPEAALKCPRCDSTNTKFCYYNNYNLNQPRYLCKACKRYWTKGGTRRNVPVGGGTRRNKRNKSSASSSSKSPTDGSSPSEVNILSPQIHPYRFMPPSSRLGEFIHGDIGLQYGVTSSPSMETNNFNHGIGVEPWRFQTSNTLNGIRHSIISSWASATQSLVKESDHHEELNLSRQILMIHGNDHNNNHQYNTNWGSGNAGNQFMD